MWNCPYCREPMPLTWKRYFVEPGLRHRCSRCGRISRVGGAFSPKLWGLRTLGALGGGIPGAIIGFHFGYWPSLVGCLLGALATGFPIDKYLDERHRQLTAIEEEKPVGDDGRCVQCGRIFKLEHMIAHGDYHVCAHCKPVFLQRLAEGDPIAPPLPKSKG